MEFQNHVQTTRCHPWVIFHLYIPFLEKGPKIGSTLHPLSSLSLPLSLPSPLPHSPSVCLNKHEYLDITHEMVREGVRIVYVKSESEAEGRTLSHSCSPRLHRSQARAIVHPEGRGKKGVGRKRWSVFSVPTHRGARIDAFDFPAHCTLHTHTKRSETALPTD